MHKGKTLFLLLLLAIVFFNVQAQVYAPASDDSITASYGADVVYIFNIPVFEGSRTDSIVAKSPDHTDGWSFQWSVYNYNTFSYEALAPVATGSSSSVDTITVTSGYQVVLTKGTEHYTYRVWLLFNDFNVTITNKDGDDKVAFGYYNCSSLDLRADTSIFELSYPKPFIDTSIHINNYYTIRWTTDNDEASNPSSSLITRVDTPPSSDTWYKITLTDNFGLKRSDSVLYESIQSEALITASYVSLGDTSVYPGKDYGYYYDDNRLSAPGKYRFDLSSSKNAAYLSIDFGDDEIYETTDASEEVIHEYAYPGSYDVILTTKSASPNECADTKVITVELDYAGFSLPNVFTPNDDGNNDLLTLYDDNNVFRSVDVSVAIIDITIFDRNGHRMHQYSGNIRDWGGWDGKVMNSNRNAPEGVYFYVISFFYAFESDDDPISSDVMKGFFHLFRE